MPTDKKIAIEEIMADNYEEINEPFRLQAKHVFFENFFRIKRIIIEYGLNASVANKKMLYLTADVAVEEKAKSLIILPIESNIEAQTQLRSKKPSERDKLLAKI